MITLQSTNYFVQIKITDLAKWPESLIALMYKYSKTGNTLNVNANQFTLDRIAHFYKNDEWDLPHRDGYEFSDVCGYDKVIDYLMLPDLYAEEIKETDDYDDSYDSDFVLDEDEEQEYPEYEDYHAVRSYGGLMSI